ncbi:primosome assembly protein PriA [Sorangium cellulosum]|uniref:Replication restart protein PriA n=1 Tax=Sorangium cellulosum TaxID=56 RepID=A0A4P2Q8Y1_SORCE|nr:primosomal protein N' [Sorangium cellulosum]AUX25711.1 primosome assembly protein PriA [Sorangium cellulosum]
MPLLADVAVPVPLAQAFTYEVPAALAAEVRPGARVLCEFHRRKLLGVVLSVSERSAAIDPSRIKPLAALVDARPALPAELLSFLQELAAYYFAPIGEVLRLALPAIEREQVRALKAQAELDGVLDLGRARQVGGRRVAFARATDVVEEPGSLRGQAAAVLALLRAGGEQPVARLEERFGNARSALKKLAGRNLVVLDEREPPRDPFFRLPEQRDVPPELNAAQVEAAARIDAALAALRAPGGAEHHPAAEQAPRSAGPSAFLLFGVTGSGKTEVYLRAIQSCLARGRGALVMVPEIALTPQLVARFRARFGDELAVLHSGLSDADRHAMWASLHGGKVRVAIGARSALFAPVPDLGLILVDEEHDGSFKQEEGVRYHARDMALLRAHRAGAVCVLGSATPSIESVALVRRGKLVELRLPDRAHREASLPEVTLVDLRRFGAGPSGDPLISLPLHRALEQTLAAKEQAILFLNRRGFAPSVVCGSCGTLTTCEACSVALTYHRGRRRDAPRPAVAGPDAPAAPAGPAAAQADERPQGGRLRCHYCDYAGPLPDRCGACGSRTLLLEGLGTERLEATIAESFPEARVARLDRDVAGKDRSQAILARMREGKIDILVGTQMVTKGHDLPNVTLVGVVNADAALGLPDFRAAERGFQLLVQVAGRAGRRDRPGRVLIQTRNPEHPAIAFAAAHDVPGFLEREIRDREEVGYPPATRLALLRIDAVDEGVGRGAAAKLAAHARTCPEGVARRVEVLGPSAAPIARLRGRYRFRVLLRARERGPLRIVLAALTGLIRDGLDRGARVIIDVDPVAML